MAESDSLDFVKVEFFSIKKVEFHWDIQLYLDLIVFISYVDEAC